MKFKKIAAVISAAAVALALAGCGKEEKKSEPGGEMTVSRFESLLENDPTFDPFEEPNANESSEPENSIPQEETYEMTDEIKNAAFDSGLIQINNDVFQQGGYITVADFVEKYKDKYDIVYEKGSYEERKDYLLAYHPLQDPKAMFEILNENYTRYTARPTSSYCLYLTPKTGSSKDLRSLSVLIGNFTSKDEKITLDKGIVIGVGLYGGSATKKSVHHVWLPQGIGLTKKLNNPVYDHLKTPEDLAKANESFTLAEFPEYLEQLGFSLTERFPNLIYNKGSVEDYDKKYEKTTSNSFTVRCVGEPNLFGLRPVYDYYFVFSSDTDKMSDTYAALIGYVD